MRKACYIALPLKKGSAVHTILHDMRVKPPSYCVKKSIENETHATSKIFDYSSLLETEEKRWAQASPQALHKKNYSPLWQGVLVLDKGYTVNANLKKAEGFTKEIEKQFGLKCLGLSVHHDEGHKDEKGNINLNPHAHIVFDRCNDDGKIIRLLRKDLMKIQNLASLYSGLQRGTPNYKKERPTKHIHHSEYRRLATEKVKSLSNTLDEIKNNNVFTAINDGLLQNKDLGMTLCSDLIKNNFEQYNIHQLHNLAKSQYQFTLFL